MNIDESQLRLEVLELTSMLNDEDDFAVLRGLLVEKGLEVKTVWMAGFMEKAEGWQGCVIVSARRDVYIFEWNAYSGVVERWEQIADPASLLDSYPAVITALEMTG